MTIKEKAKAYDKAKARMSRAFNSNRCTIGFMNEIFPEFEVSEDEKIRKELITWLQNTEGQVLPIDRYNAALAWLEKQGNESINIDIESMVSSYEQRVVSQCNGVKSNPFVNMCVSAFRHGIENTLEELNLKKLEKQGEQKPTDKVKPKFKIGDWVVYYRNDSSREVIQVYDIRDDRYYFTDNVHFSWSVKECDEKCHLWTIEDAKDGDVLYLQKDGKEHIIIYKGVLKERFRTFVSAYCAYNGIVDAFCFADVSRYIDIAYKGIMPATKTQRDILAKAMLSLGYTFDFDKKELKKIEKELKKNNSYCQEHCKGFQETGKCFTDGDCKDKREAERKSAWSEEDEEIMSSLLSFLLINTSDQWAKYGKWLKELKERIGG